MDRRCRSIRTDTAGILFSWCGQTSYLSMDVHRATRAPRYQKSPWSITRLMIATYSASMKVRTDWEQTEITELSRQIARSHLTLGEGQWCSFGHRSKTLFPPIDREVLPGDVSCSSCHVICPLKAVQGLFRRSGRAVIATQFDTRSTANAPERAYKS